jgi:uncharacterized alkaline shock family protein YloU
MEEREFKKSEGTCIISEEVIATIASTAATEVPGVASMVQRPDIRSMIAGGANGRFVKVTGSETAMTLDVYISIRQGVRIPEVSEQVQRDVKTAVQSMTGKPVAKVNVHISGLSLEEEK